MMNQSENKHNTTPYGNARSYLTGFLFSIILTIIPFWIVMNSFGSKKTIITVILISALVQVLVHLIYFLHLNHKSEGGWNLIAIVFIIIIMLIIVLGSLWIMWNLNYNMMRH